MSDPNEQPEAPQQEAASPQANAEGRSEATEAAERKAQELGVDLTNVEGTGSGGRVTAPDVENAYRQTDTTARSTETLQGGGSLPPTPPTPPTLEDIHRQYVVLKATLAGPKDGTVPLRIIREDGSLEDPITEGTFPDNPSNFFAPEPPVVNWVLPDPQPPIPTTLEGPKQPCRVERCTIDGFGRDVGRSLLGPY